MWLIKTLNFDAADRAAVYKYGTFYFGVPLCVLLLLTYSPENTESPIKAVSFIFVISILLGTSFGLIHRLFMKIVLHYLAHSDK